MTINIMDQSDEEYRAERAAWNAEFERRHGRPPTYDDVIASFGGRAVGCSQDTGRRSGSGSTDDGIVGQT